MALVVGALLPLAANAEPSADGMPGGRWQSLTPEQRQQMRSQIKEHWEQMSPEERQRKRDEMRERWERLPPEERQQLRERIREHRQEYPRGEGRGG